MSEVNAIKNALLFVAVVLTVAVLCQARIITVDNDGPADFNNIQAAIDDANDGDTVEIQLGTYTGLGNRDIDFVGKVVTVCSTDPNDPSVVAATIIDCNGTAEEPHRGFYFHSGEDANSILDGFTIINGYGPNEPWGRRSIRRAGQSFATAPAPQSESVSSETTTATTGVVVSTAMTATALSPGTMHRKTVQSITRARRRQPSRTASSTSATYA